jgi:hypothetical protein
MALKVSEGPFSPSFKEPEARTAQDLNQLFDRVVIDLQKSQERLYQSSHTSQQPFPQAVDEILTIVVTERSLTGEKSPEEILLTAKKSMIESLKHLNSSQLQSLRGLLPNSSDFEFIQESLSFARSLALVKALPEGARDQHVESLALRILRKFKDPFYARDMVIRNIPLDIHRMSAFRSIAEGAIDLLDLEHFSGLLESFQLTNSSQFNAIFLDVLKRLITGSQEGKAAELMDLHRTELDFSNLFEQAMERGFSLSSLVKVSDPSFPIFQRGSQTPIRVIEHFILQDDLTSAWKTVLLIQGSQQQTDAVIRLLSISTHRDRDLVRSLNQLGQEDRIPLLNRILGTISQFTPKHEALYAYALTDPSVDNVIKHQALSKINCSEIRERVHTLTQDPSGFRLPVIRHLVQEGETDITRFNILSEYSERVPLEPQDFEVLFEIITTFIQTPFISDKIYATLSINCAKHAQTSPKVGPTLRQIQETLISHIVDQDLKVSTVKHVAMILGNRVNTKDFTHFIQTSIENREMRSNVLSELALSLFEADPSSSTPYSAIEEIEDTTEQERLLKQIQETPKNWWESVAPPPQFKKS